ncbi:MAG: LCP family protein [Tissierellaceae bacterium]|jgi:LCP family protein required for cell wall assembly
MRTFLKAFIVSFLAFFVAFYLGTRVSLVHNSKISGDMDIGFAENIHKPNRLLTKFESQPSEPEEFSSLEEAFEKSQRLNFIILGMEDVRTDTIVLGSLCQRTKTVDLIAIPRDTYIHRKGYDEGGKRRINSVYQDHGISGVKQTISYIMAGIPIHYYVIIDYEGVEKLVDLVGGVEVDVPFHMKYRDSSSDPPLDIDIKEGRQLLKGKEALDFIRYRKGNNRMGYPDGDLGRIKAQQAFLKAFASKAMDNLVPIISKGLKYIETDLRLMEALTYGRNMIGASSEDIRFRLLPGKPDLREVDKRIYSYYIYNDRETKAMLEEIYNVRGQGINKAVD